MRYSGHWSLALSAALLLTSCATTKTDERRDGIGPYSELTGRLLIMQPSQRWQVALEWRGTPDAGHARLTHAASNRIVEIEWLQAAIRMRDNQQQPAWKQVSESQLAEQGIIMPPQQLAALLNGTLPTTLKRRGENRWEGTVRDSYLKLTWQPDAQRLSITDITHGNSLVLIIQP